MDYRTLLAAVLGVGLGALMIAFPAAIVRVHTVGRRPQDPRGEYGGEGASFAKYHWLIRGIGGLVAIGGLYFGYTLVA